MVKYGEIATCHNNCHGVDPSAIIGAGVAAVVAGGVAAQAVLPAIGAGVAGLGGAGAVGLMGMLRQQQPPQSCSQTQCRVRYLLPLALQLQF